MSGGVERFRGARAHGRGGGHIVGRAAAVVATAALLALAVDAQVAQHCEAHSEDGSEDKASNLKTWGNGTLYCGKLPRPACGCGRCTGGPALRRTNRWLRR